MAFVIIIWIVLYALVRYLWSKTFVIIIWIVLYALVRYLWPTLYKKLFLYANLLIRDSHIIQPFVYLVKKTYFYYLTPTSTYFSYLISLNTV